ncbi:Cytochrome P450,Cytochrome P450, E-class, group IV [Cinara cedri]|uniref:Cytochrome P450,Cytochrome P450, E-class, group IV n=1 Tax=Cinara cedri TaxID=506608 RepID=A0A5E4M259_9HEMI|nr:Cytochrome P450,Cytochrome P450, E-class, group IV [Cinara cedri]
MHILIQKVMDLNESNTWNFIFMLLLAILVIIMIVKFKNRRTTILANKIPGPDGLFLVGILPVVIQGPEKFLTNCSKLYRMYEKSLFKVWLFDRLLIVLTQPEDIEFVFTNPKLQKKSKEYSILRESIMGQGIFTNDDIQKWKNNRKMVSGGLSFSMIKSFIPIFYEEANVLSEILNKKCDLKSKECDISIPVSMATMEMIGKTALDVTFNAQNNSRHRFIDNLQTTLQTWEYRITHPWYLSKTLFKWSKVSQKHDQSQQIINEFTDEIINEKFSKLNQNTEGNHKRNLETDDEVIGRKMKTVIEILLENYHGMSHKQIREELITIMIGGQETTAMTNACTIFMLAHHQDVQDKVFEEIQTIFSTGDRDRPPTYEDMQQMTYLERVIKETLRLFPPLPIIARKLEEEMKIGKHLCPAGSSLLISPLYLQSSPEYYADPDKFDPDHFLPDACHDRHPYAFIPFSAGFRNCIGIKYAMVQMKTVISTLVRENKFSPSDRCPTPEHLRLMFLTTLKFVDGCHVKIERRGRDLQ